MVYIFVYILCKIEICKKFELTIIYLFQIAENLIDFL